MEDEESLKGDEHELPHDQMGTPEVPTMEMQFDEGGDAPKSSLTCWCFLSFYCKYEFAYLEL